MRFMITFGHTDEELAAAQWAVAEAFRRAIGRSNVDPNTQQRLCEMLAQAPSSDPEQWAAGAAASLASAIARLRTDVEKKDRTLDHLRRERDSLNRTVADHDAHPLHEQIKTLSEERDHWRDLTISAERRAQTLENAHRAACTENDQLQTEVADLNRIIVEQQMALNGEYD
ncbi:MAG: hypothetical protein B6I35_13335 [Anaerolineaceae bacterium 4572_32.2]|nr:MAG: hypothetical protein B6I35_13335 [Anaerolineaceae bacterium 4572_32.2]RLC71231.1 MAG: hypothetical protein DRI81_18010 [Chloroflexota bacterium]